MPAPISIVIPTLNAAPTMGPTLACVFEAMTAGLVREVILADGGSRDGTAEAGRALGCVIVSSPPGRGVQLAAGVAAARGDWVLVLHADTTLGPGWIEAVGAHVRGETRAGYFHLGFDEASLPARIVAGWANLRSRVFGLPYGDQGVLLPMALYRAVGGYPEIPLMEDVALARALRGRLVPLGATAVTSAARYRRDGWVRRGWRNLSTLTLYFLGTDPERLARRYRRAA